jgi:hypothetical protein
MQDFGFHAIEENLRGIRHAERIYTQMGEKSEKRLMNLQWK